MLSRQSSNKIHHHRHQHNNHFPPRDYTDLSRSDIESLAPIFGPLPKPSTSAAASHNARLKHHISALPPHLRAKIPQLSTFCSNHDKLNPLPINDLLQVIQNELQLEALERWKGGTRVPLNMLQDVNMRSHRCAACNLSFIAVDVEVVVWLGAITIARLRPKDWEKSKRILWFEEWLKACDAEGQIGRMWEEGSKLREVVKEDRGNGGDRPWVRAYVERAMEGSGPWGKVLEERTEARPSAQLSQVSKPHLPRRPARTQNQGDHVAFVTEALQMAFENPFDDPTSPTTTIVPSPTSARNHSKDLHKRLDVNDLFDSNDEAGATTPTHVSSRPQYVASSVYSRSSQETLCAVRPPATRMLTRNASLSVTTTMASTRSSRISSRSRVSESQVIDAYRADTGDRAPEGNFF